jgi:hypothetical protein
MNSHPQRHRDPRPWRNLRTPQQLPPPAPDRWQWLPGEVVFGPPRQRPENPPTEPVRQASQGGGS